MSRIVITKGRPYDLAITIKQPGSLNIASLTDTAEGVFYFIDKQDNKMLLTINMTRIGMADEGKFLLEMTADETNILPSRYSLGEDGMLPMDTCRGHIGITDINNPLPELRNVDVIIPSIYVANLGE